MRQTVTILLLPVILLAQDIPEATKVRVRLEQPLSSATADDGQPVQLAVSEDVKINDVVVIPHDTVVNGTVVQSVAKRRMGRTGKLDFSIDTIVLEDGSKIPVRYSVVKKEGGSHATSTGIITAGVAVVFWPAAPFILLRKGKDTVYNKGVTFDVFTDTAYSVKAHAASGGETALKNDDLIALKKAGFSDAVIISKIDAEPGAYKLDTQAMIDLKAAGLSDDVIAAMIKRGTTR